MKDKIYASFDGRDNMQSLTSLCTDLMKDQKSKWQLLQDSYHSLDQSVHRFLRKDGFSYQIQFNPGRIFSAAAKVDQKSIAKRKCFLCIKNLPSAQMGILYREEYLILCNPLPIFSEHFTITHIEHLPQTIDNSFSTFLQAARDLSPQYTVFYNGPECGASAPDHLHFQAVPAGVLPIEKDVSVQKNFRKVADIQGATLYKAMNADRTAIMIESSKIKDVRIAFSHFMDVMKNRLKADAEPMINVIGSYCKGHWRIFIFPRRKFRPSLYYLEEERRLLVSPGAVEMAGLIVTPRKKDFKRLDIEGIEAIYREISLEDELLERIIQDLTGGETRW